MVSFGAPEHIRSPGFTHVSTPLLDNTNIPRTEPSVRACVRVCVRDGGWWMGQDVPLCSYPHPFSQP